MTPYIARVKHMHEVCGKSILETRKWPLYPKWPRKDIGVPSVVKLIVNYKEDYCPMVQEWQMYAYDLMRLRVRELYPALNPSDVDKLAKRVFASFYRDNAWQSNKRGTVTRADYVNGTNTDKEPIGLQPIVTGDMRVQITGEQVKAYGVTCVPVACFDGNAQPPKASDVNWHTAPHLIGFPTIETRIKVGKNDREVRLIELAGVKGIPVFVILRGMTIAWLDVTRVDVK